MSAMISQYRRARQGRRVPHPCSIILERIHLYFPNFTPRCRPAPELHGSMQWVSANRLGQDRAKKEKKGLPSKKAVSRIETKITAELRKR